MTVPLSVQWVFQLMLALLGGGLLLSMVRLIRGPSLPDRVLTLDMMIMLVLAIIAVYAILYDQAVLIDVGLIFALVGFIATVAFALYVEKRL